MRTYPISEIFGPTFQGEGPSAGERCWFVRFGGCDYRCSWCDTMYAVEPALVRELERVDAPTIRERLADLGAGGGDLVILSGGNPALQHGEELMHKLVGMRVHVETQGTVYRPWLNRCELVVVSPKPPSAETADPVRSIRQACLFVNKLTADWILKFVAFDEADLDWIAEARSSIDPQRRRATFISAGTNQEADNLADAALSGFSWLAEHVAAGDERLAGMRVGLQLHVLVWPGEKAR